LENLDAAKGTPVEEMIEERGGALVSFADVRDTILHAPDLLLRDDEERHIRAEWLEVMDQDEPPKKTIWQTQYLIDRVEATVASGWEGVVFFEHEAVGLALRERGLDVAMGGDEIPRYDGRGVICLSYAFERGFDLPKWSKMLVLCPKSDGASTEQLYGRIHRGGQRKAVDIHVFAPYDVLRRSMNKAFERSQYIEDSLGMNQKLQLAEVKWKR